MMNVLFSHRPYLNCLNNIPLCQILVILTPLMMYAHTSPIRAKQPYLCVFLNKNGIHLVMEGAPGLVVIVKTQIWMLRKYRVSKKRKKTCKGNEGGGNKR